MKELVINNYSFDASAQTITIYDQKELDISQILLIANITSNETIYSPYTVGKGGTITSNVITLAFDTTSMADTDSLQIFVQTDSSVPITFSFEDGVTDAFGRQRISQPHAIFENANILNSSPLVWEDILTTGGTLTHLPNEGAVQLSVTSTIGSKTMREQHGYNRYFPGKSQLFYGTMVLDTAVVGIRKRVGYFNDLNGFYIEQDTDGTLYLVLRTYTSGSAVNNRVAQSNWTSDTLDGSRDGGNPSGILLDVTKIQIIVIDFQWLGAGKVRYGLNIGGKTYYVHEIENANVISTTYMSTGNLPIRYEIENVSSVSGASMKIVCASIQSEGGEGAYAYTISASNGITTKSIGGTRTQLISIQLAGTVSGNINRAKIIPINISMLTKGTDSVFYELILQRAHLSENNLGGTPTWNAITNSVCEYSVDGTTITGGTVIESGFVSGQSRSIDINLDSRDFMALNSAGTTSDWLHLAVTNTDAGSINCSGSIHWREFY